MSGAPQKRFLIVFSDLDGTLLDHDTYEWKKAKSGLDRLKKYGFPVILVSSKTRAEMVSLRKALSVTDPFITENGGGVFFGRHTFPEPPDRASVIDAADGLLGISLGLSYRDLVRELKEIGDELGLHLKGFSSMDVEMIRHLTGLDRKSALLALTREFDEPFMVADQKAGDKEALRTAAARRGLHVSDGGRFYHLHGGNNKGQAMDMIVSLYRDFCEAVATMALGDSPNDFPMLERADYPVLVRSKRTFSRVEQRIPRLIYTEKFGPSGWNEAVTYLLDTEFSDP